MDEFASTADPLADDPLADAAPDPGTPPAAGDLPAEAPAFGGERGDDELPEPAEPPAEPPAPVEPTPEAAPAEYEPEFAEPEAPAPEPEPEPAGTPPAPPVEPPAAPPAAPDEEPPAPAQASASKDKERPYTVLEGLPLSELVGRVLEEQGVTAGADIYEGLKTFERKVFFELGEDVQARNPDGALRGLFKREQAAGATEINKFLGVLPRSSFQPKQRRVGLDVTVSID